MKNIPENNFQKNVRKNIKEEEEGKPQLIQGYLFILDKEE